MGERLTRLRARPRPSGDRRLRLLSMDYTPSELMVAAAARELRDGEVVFVGIGLPNLACNLARRTHAPGLVLIYESGAVGAQPERVPVSIGDPALVAGALGIAIMAEVFDHYLQAGRIDVGFLQGAQIDRAGNLNTTVIGDYRHPKVRLPGSGGACEIAIHARRVVVVAPQSRRSFPERLDFRTSPGHLRSRRRRAGRPRGGAGGGGHPARNLHLRGRGDGRRHSPSRRDARGGAGQPRLGAPARRTIGLDAGTYRGGSASPARRARSGSPLSLVSSLNQDMLVAAEREGRAGLRHPTVESRARRLLPEMAPILTGQRANGHIC